MPVERLRRPLFYQQVRTPGQFVQLDIPGGELSDRIVSAIFLIRTTKPRSVHTGACLLPWLVLSFA